VYTCTDIVMTHLTHTARNLKFYPLSLHKSLKEGNPLHFLASKFYIETCQGEQKLFSTLTNWELLNLKPSDILDIPDRLFQEHCISNAFLSEVMNKYTIQSTGKDVLEDEFGIQQPCQYMVAKTRHYSWPKGAGMLSSPVLKLCMYADRRFQSHCGSRV
jgi:hypothetical protein